jgi:uncharacterized membrane protein YbaN (DUF454 family)
MKKPDIQCDGKHSKVRLVRNALLSACGLVALGLGTIGIILPLLPTTPFLLLAAFCFFHGSPGLHRWLESRPWIGAQLRLWRSQRSVSEKTRKLALIYLWLMIGISVFQITGLVYQLGLLMIAVIVSGILLRLKTHDTTTLMDSP